MVHRIYPILIGLALGLAFLVPQPAAAAVETGVAPEYSRLIASGLASRDASPSNAWGGSIRTAQAGTQVEDDAGESRKKLKRELDLIRAQAPAGPGSSSFDPPLPVRKNAGQNLAEAADPAGRQAQQTAHPADPQIDRLTGQLLLMNFRGSQPSDAGTRAIRSLLQSGLIAGVVFGRENISSRAQLRELMKFFWPAGAPNRPVFGLHEIGGASDALPPVKDFERWPSESDVAAKGDPQYAYSTYRSMGASLAVLGFNLNFGPVLTVPGDGQDPSASFGNNPLQTGVFAKTFILGHREENVVAVPIVDRSGHSVRALKALLVADPATPIGSALNNGAPFSAYEGLGWGVRFCFVAPAAGDGGASAVNGFKSGCDILVLEGGTESPAAIRDQVALALSQAVQNGDLTVGSLNAAAERFGQLRSSEGHDWAASSAQRK